MNTSSPAPDLRTSNEKAIDLMMNSIPLNSYWYNVSKKSNKIPADNLSIITEHKYYNVYSYASDRSGFVYNKCIEIKYDSDSWRIYPNGSLFNINDCKEISKEEFEKIENNFIKSFCNIELNFKLF